MIYMFARRVNETEWYIGRRHYRPTTPTIAIPNERNDQASLSKRSKTFNHPGICWHSPLGFQWESGMKMRKQMAMQLASSPKPCVFKERI